MSNPDDPRTEKFDRPTDQFGRPIGADGPTQSYHTADPYQAYGQSPPPNSTMAFPTYRGDPYQQQQPWGEAPPLEQTQEPKRKSRLWPGILIGLVVLSIAAVVAFFATSGGPESSSATGTSTTAPAPRTTAPPRTSQAPSATSELQLPPALGDAIDSAGATVGSIAANDGGTLTVDAVTGGPVTVRTNAQTQIVAISGSNVADLKVGDSVVVQGDKAEDGSITARIIISTSLPNLDGFGR